MKFRLTLAKTVEIDTEVDYGGDVSFLHEALVDLGEDTSKQITDVGVLRRAVEHLLNDDLDSVHEWEIEAGDIQVQIDEGQSLPAQYVEGDQAPA